MPCRSTRCPSAKRALGERIIVRSPASFSISYASSLSPVSCCTTRQKACPRTNQSTYRPSGGPAEHQTAERSRRRAGRVIGGLADHLVDKGERRASKTHAQDNQVGRLRSDCWEINLTPPEQITNRATTKIDMNQLVPCGSIAPLRLEQDHLVPLAVSGLSPDALGRRFKVEEHPRLAALLEHRGATRFATDCDLPDPYDRLVECRHGRLEVHDCLGCPLFINGRPWGLLTLNSLDPSRFGQIALNNLETVALLAAATVQASERMSSLSRRLESEAHLTESSRLAAGQRQPAEIIGQSAVLQRLLGEIALVAGSELTVLIGGETGVGKELVAQALHSQSPRAERPLISLNCAALPETLVESELFGHVRGAFSGAVSERAGKFEIANGSTLFLDEVGELPLPVQAKLLRVLQSGSCSGWAPTENTGSMSGYSRPPTATSPKKCAPGASTPTSSIASACTRCMCPHCVNAAATSCCWPATSWSKAGPGCA